MNIYTKLVQILAKLVMSVRTSNIWPLTCQLQIDRDYFTKRVHNRCTYVISLLTLLTSINKKLIKNLEQYSVRWTMVKLTFLWVVATWL